MSAATIEARRPDGLQVEPMPLEDPLRVSVHPTKAGSSPRLRVVPDLRGAPEQSAPQPTVPQPTAPQPTAPQPTAPQPAVSRPAVPARPSRRRRAGRGSGRRAHPAVRPVGAVPPPVLGKTAGTGDQRGTRARACSVAAAGPGVDRVAARPATSRWRLTDRGVTVVLVAGAMVLAAAVTVITATALTVTGADYQSSPVVSIHR